MVNMSYYGGGGETPDLSYFYPHSLILHSSLLRDNYWLLGEIQVAGVGYLATKIVRYDDRTKCSLPESPIQPSTKLMLDLDLCITIP